MPAGLRTNERKEQHIEGKALAKWDSLFLLGAEMARRNLIVLANFGVVPSQKH